MDIWKIAILVENVQEAEDLYAKKLGMEILERRNLGDFGEALFLDGGNIKLEIIPKKVFAGQGRLDKLGLHHLSFKVDSIQSVASELKNKGISFIKEPYERPGGLTIAFFDGLNGVNLQLFEKK